MRKSSRGNPYHDEKGRFCSGPKGGSKYTVSQKTPEEYEKQTEERIRARLPETDFETELKERAERNANKFISEWMDSVGVDSFEIKETSYDYRTSTVNLIVSETDPGTDPTPFRLQLYQNLNGRMVLYNEDGGYDVIEDAYENGLIDEVDLDWFRNYKI